MPKILLIAFFTIGCIACKNSSESQILNNGDPASTGIANQTVKINAADGGLCTGSIVKTEPIVVQTAAHCVVDRHDRFVADGSWYQVQFSNGKIANPERVEVNQHAFKEVGVPKIDEQSNPSPREQPLEASNIEHPSVVIVEPGKPDRPLIKTPQESTPNTAFDAKTVETVPNSKTRVLKTMAEGLSEHDTAYLHFSAALQVEGLSSPKIGDKFADPKDSVTFAGFGHKSPTIPEFPDGLRQGSINVHVNREGKVTSTEGSLLGHAPQGKNTVAGGDSGGPVFNQKGEIIGVISGVTFNAKEEYAVTIFTDINTIKNRKFLDANLSK